MSLYLFRLHGCMNTELLALHCTSTVQLQNYQQQRQRAITSAESGGKLNNNTVEIIHANEEKSSVLPCIYYEIMATGQQMFPLVKAIKWSSLRWELVKCIFPFSPVHLFISNRCESKDVLGRWTVCASSISHCSKMWRVCELLFSSVEPQL